jgi:Hus1-like protein
MKFKATLAREEFALFFNHFKLLAEQGRTAVIILSSSVVRTVLKEDVAMEIRATLSTASIFDVFEIQSRNHHTIAVQLSLGNFVHALRAGLHAQSTGLKLTKRGSDPFICITSTIVEGGAEVIQDVPVKVLQGSEASAYEESNLSLEDIRYKLMFPSPRPVSMVVDRMKMLLGNRPGGTAAAVNGTPGSGMVTSASGRDGTGGGVGSGAGAGGLIRVDVDPKKKEVTFSIQTETVAVKSFFSNLGSPSADAASSSSGAGGGAEGAAAEGEADGGAGYGDATTSAAGLDGSSSAAAAAVSSSSSKAIVFVGSRHLSKAIKAIANLGTALGLVITKRRNIVIFGENGARTASFTFLLSMVDTGME